MLPLAAVLLAMVIFAIDTFVPLGMAIAVLYVVVVLMGMSFLSRRGVLVVGAACAALTLFSFVWQHGLEEETSSVARLLMSLAAISITTLLASRALSASLAVGEQARLLDLTHDTIFVRDMRDVITFWNRAAEALYGFSREQALGQSSHRLLQTVFPARLDAITAELLRTGRWEGELVHTTRDGTQVVVASRWALGRDPRGRPIAILETNNDITERNRAQEGLYRAQAELAHVTRVATLGELTASIAHEVNQPLAAIVTNAEASLRWLGRTPADLEEVRSAVQRVISDGRRASEVIRRLRALARKGDPQRDVIDLNELIDEAIQLVQRELQRHRVILTLELEPALAPIIGDRVQLQQVLVNLLINAVQAMASLATASRELRVESQLRDGEALVAVYDSGVGLDADSAIRLFSPFFTTKPSGMGMGLSISRSIVEAHGGRIWGSGHDGPGAVFRFTLPLGSDTNV